jgi:hypothetical protein
MKRKVKFQEGGEVVQPARRPARESARNRQLRETMERVRREGRRVGLAERARQRQTASDAARRATTAERAAAQREVERLNPGQGAAEAERRAGRAVPERRPDFTTDPRGTTRRGAADGRAVAVRREPPVPVTPSAGRDVGAPRPSMQRAMTDVLTPRQMPLGRVRPPVGGNLATMAAGTAVAAAEPLADYARSFMDRRAAEADARREANLQANRVQELDRMRAALPERPDEATEMRNALPVRPNIAAERRAAARPAPRRELTMEEIRALRSGERAPRSSEERALREGLRDLPVMTEADRLNERELQRIRAARAAEEEAARQMGGSGNIGSASARERGELEGHPGDFTYNNYKKGGMVKPKAAPKKMMKGGIVAKPKAAAKSKPKSKPMPFKKGGVIKKGRK